MLKVDIKSKIYKMKNESFTALENVQFELGNSGLVCILGPSGSGKTTLMNLIGALDFDFEGDVLINGKSLKEAKSKDLDSYRKNTIGFIFQQFYLINKFTAYDNVKLALSLSNIKDKKDKIYSLLKMVEMERFAKRKVNVLSGGQKQRIAIARALANDPDIILADEPTGALDTRIGHEVMVKLKELSKDKLVIVITHSEALAEEFADTVISMEDGKIINIENKTELVNKDEQEKKYTRSVMSYMTAFTHSLKSLWTKKARTIATSIGMSIGIVGIALAFALSNGSTKIVRDQVESIMPVNMVTIDLKSSSNKDAINIGLNPKSLPEYTYNDLENIKKLNSNISHFWPVPASAMQDFFSEVSLNEDNAKSADFEDESFMLLNGPEPYENINNSLTSGRKPENTEEIVISLNTAQTLLGEGSNDENIKSLVGKNLYVKYGPNMYVGRDSDKNRIVTFKIVGITSINTMGNSIYQTSDQINQLYADLTETKKEDMKYVRAYLYLKSNLSNTQIKDTINNLNSSQTKYEFKGSADTILDGVQVFMDTVRNVLIGFSSISVIVAILMIGIVIFISVLERISEIGILRAIGARRKDIRNIFLSESAIIGLFSGIIGVAVSYGMCEIINYAVSMLIKSSGMQIDSVKVAVLDPVIAIILVLVCAFLALFAGMIPSVKAARMDPIEALRRK
ncbi:MAG: ATP-binding cassette domain-containing protein [Clostridia bacterium]|nr:ATP-binding cassette domain-containing protein [Clostridia bacterium]